MLIVPFSRSANRAQLDPERAVRSQVTGALIRPGDERAMRSSGSFRNEFLSVVTERNGVLSHAISSVSKEQRGLIKVVCAVEPDLDTYECHAIIRICQS